MNIYMKTSAHSKLRDYKYIYILLDSNTYYVGGLVHLGIITGKRFRHRLLFPQPSLVPQPHLRKRSSLTSCCKATVSAPLTWSPAESKGGSAANEVAGANQAKCINTMNKCI